MVNICTNISCQLMGGEELLERAEAKLGISAGETTADGKFTIEDVECIAACTEAPCLSVNYRYRHRVTLEQLDQLLDDLAAGTVADVPEHGTLAQVRQHIPPERLAGILPPEEAGQPVWIGGPEEAVT